MLAGDTGRQSQDRGSQSWCAAEPRKGPVRPENGASSPRHPYSVQTRLCISIKFSQDADVAGQDSTPPPTPPPKRV